MTPPLRRNMTKCLRQTTIQLYRSTLEELRDCIRVYHNHDDDDDDDADDDNDDDDDDDDDDDQDDDVDDRSE